jgi:hypothetical protein
MADGNLPPDPFAHPSRSPVAGLRILICGYIFQSSHDNAYTVSHKSIGYHSETYDNQQTIIHYEVWRIRDST